MLAARADPPQESLERRKTVACQAYDCGREEMWEIWLKLSSPCILTVEFCDSEQITENKAITIYSPTQCQAHTHII